MKRLRKILALGLAFVLTFQSAAFAGLAEPEMAETSAETETASEVETEVIPDQKAGEDVNEVAEIVEDSDNNGGSSESEATDDLSEEGSILPKYISVMTDSSGPSFGYIDVDYDTSPIGVTGSGDMYGAGISSFPASYSSIAEGYTTSIKDQGQYPLCWAFSYTEAAESYMFENNSSDDAVYSPLGLAYFFYNRPDDPLGLIGTRTANTALNSNFLSGGNTLFTAVALTGWIGLQDEDVIPYSSASSSLSLDFSNCSNSAVQTGAYFYHYDGKKPIDPKYTDINQIKRAIMENGSVICAYHASDGAIRSIGNNKWGYFQYCPYKTASNHAVQIVGWDDSVSSSMFSTRVGNEIKRPAGNGAWLVRNSWGEEWPYHTKIDNKGCFWMSYYDMSINDVTAVEFAPASDYKSNYHYDGASGLMYSSLKYAGNVFKAQGTERITAVNVGFDSTNVSYTIKVYVSGGQMQSPVDGELVSSVSGSTEAAGFYTIELDTPVVVEKDTWFSVSVETTDTVRFFVESTYQNGDWIAFTADLKPGESYFSNDGVKYSDLYYSNFCVRIKAYTEETSIVIVAQPEDQTGVEGSAASFTVQARGEGLTYQWQWSRNGSEWYSSALGTARTAELEVPCTADRNGQYYRCQIKDSSNNTVFTEAARLTVTEPPIVIVTQPEDQTGVEGSAASFTVQARGEGLTYQWQWSRNGSEWYSSALGTARTAELRVPCTADRNGQYYRCQIKDNSNNTLISISVKLTIAG